MREEDRQLAQQMEKIERARMTINCFLDKLKTRDEQGRRNLSEIATQIAYATRQSCSCSFEYETGQYQFRIGEGTGFSVPAREIRDAGVLGRKKIAEKVVEHWQTGALSNEGLRDHTFLTEDGLNISRIGHVPGIGVSDRRRVNGPLPMGDGWDDLPDATPEEIRQFNRRGER